MTRRRKPTGSPARLSVSLSPSWRAALPDSAAAVAWSASGLLGVATLAGPVIFLDAATGARVHEAPGHPGGALAVAFGPSHPSHPSHALVATGGEDGEVHLSGERFTDPPLRLEGGGAAVGQLSWSPDGEVLASAAGRVVRFWSRAGALLGEVADHPSTVTSLSWSKPAAGWLSACYGGVHLLSRDGLRRARLLPFRTSILAAAPSPDGRFVAAGTQDPVVRVWDLERDDDVINLEGYPGKVPLVAWGEETMILASASAATVVLWSFAGGGDPRDAGHAELPGHGKRVTALRFLRGGRALLTASADGRVRVFDLAVSEAARALVAELDLGAPLHLAAVAPTGDQVVAAGTDGSLVALRLG